MTKEKIIEIFKEHEYVDNIVVHDSFLACEDYEETAEKILHEIQCEQKELLHFIAHMYVNYNLPYGPIDAWTQKQFEKIRKKYKSNFEKYRKEEAEGN